MPRPLAALLLALAAAARADDARPPDPKAAAPAWTLDPARMTPPDRPAAGTLLGQPFRVGSARLAGNQLTLSAGGRAGDSRIWVVLGSPLKPNLAGETITLGPELPFGTTVHLVRAAAGDVPRQVQFPKAVAVRLEFGQPKGGKLPGKVYLCAGDKQTVVAGTFEVAADGLGGPAPPPADGGPLPPKAAPGRPAVPAKDAPEWLTDPARMIAPDAPVAGNILGGAFKLEKAELSGGVLTLRQGAGFHPDAAAILFLFLGDDSPAGRTFLAGGQSAGGPHVHLKRMNPGEMVPHGPAMSGNFGLRLEFGPARGGVVKGKIYLCCPDDGQGQTSIAGRFEVPWPAR